MKTNNSKKHRKKIIPLCYQKKNLSKSNTSLSQLLSLAAYKKRINELVRNNRSLAVALQEARCETAFQNNLLKDYARDSNQVMFARLKLKEMTNTITKLVTDLDEVVTCLNVDWTSANYQLQKNGLVHDRLKIKRPSIDCIEEVSMVSSENEDCALESVSQPIASSEVASDKVCDNKENAYEIQPCSSKCDLNLPNTLNMPPVLSEDSEEQEMKDHSSRKSSKRHSVIDQTLLTPELDIDFSCFNRKRSSSRRQTVLLTPARSTRSREISKFNLASSFEYATPKRSLSSALNNCERYSDENKILDEAFVNIKKRGSKKTNSSPLDLDSVSLHITDHDVDLNKSSIKDTANTVLNNEAVVSNHTILLCEDMELTDVIHPIEQITAENYSKPLGNSNIQSNVPGKSEEFNESTEKMCCEDELPKLNKISKCVTVFSKDIHNLNEEENKNYDYILDNVSENNGTFEHIESVNEKHLTSPLLTRSSHNRKNANYERILFSESESDSSPITPETTKKTSNVIKRETVIFKPKTSSSTDNHESAKKIPLQSVNKMSLNTSVYDLDVSNSEKPAKKSRQKLKTKKSSNNKEISKPLLPKCNVTKLKSHDYKFTKNEKSVGKQKGNQLLQKHKSLLDAKTTVCTNSPIKRNQRTLFHNIEQDTDATCNNREAINPTENEELTSGITDFKHEEICLGTPKSETKRVSFASTDLVCNFSKRSLSKTIAGNKKIQRASKSVFEVGGLLDQQTSETMHFQTNKSPDYISGTALRPEELFNFCEDTELYTFMPPSNIHQIPVTTNEDSSETAVSSITVGPKMSDSCDDPNSMKSPLPVKSKLRKLSLKGNKSSQKKAQPHTPDKIDKDSESLNSYSPAVKSKGSRKGSLNDLKENMHTNSQSLDIADAKTQIKSKTSKQSHVSLVGDSNMEVPIDDNLAFTKGSLQRDHLSQTHKLFQPTPGKASKNSNSHRKTVEPSPVLKDVMNLEANIGNRDSTKRRSKTVCYKEPRLNKKMRRD